MSIQSILRTVEFKLYPNKAQAESLARFLQVCCWVYNQALEHRIKSYKRRKESPSRYNQQKLLTVWRQQMERLRNVPSEFERSALARLERGMNGFFHRVKVGEKPGFPRFRPHHRYNSLECLAPYTYLRLKSVHIPGVGLVRARGRLDVVGKQKLLRVIRRASGWYAQVVVDQGSCQIQIEPKTSVGIDMGLTSFATLSTGEKIDNPRWARKSAQSMRHAQRKVSRRVKGSNSRRKAVKQLSRQHERIAAQRKDFAHQESRKLVTRFGLIGFEKLSIAGLARTRMAKSVMDAAWGLFLFFVTYKAESAGRHAVAVDPRGTSQECPLCGLVKKKSLFERVHRCECGLVLDRDHASAKVILARALAVAGRMPVEDWPLRRNITSTKAGPMKQEVQTNAMRL